MPEGGKFNFKKKAPQKLMFNQVIEVPDELFVL